MRQTKAFENISADAKVDSVIETLLKVKKKKKKSQLIRPIHTLFQRRFARVSSVHFQALITKILRCKYYNKWILIRGNGNVQTHDQEGNKFNSTINANTGDHTITYDKIIKVHPIINNVATIKIGTLVPM